MNEYLIAAHSFAAPFCSDTSTHLVEAESPKAALEKLAATYKHPAGLYAAGCYESARAFHAGGKVLARWISNHAKALEGATVICSHGPGDVEIDHKRVKIENPKDGAVVDVVA